MTKGLKPHALELHELWLETEGKEGECFDLSGAKLFLANLRSADLCEASLCGANLCGANFDGANFDGASFDGASFYGANLSKAKNLDKAIMPKGWKLVKEDNND
jgi:uncharacterized protein YjbI with pentapeptide repeats